MLSLAFRGTAPPQIKPSRSFTPQYTGVLLWHCMSAPRQPWAFLARSCCMSAFSRSSTSLGHLWAAKVLQSAAGVCHIVHQLADPVPVFVQHFLALQHVPQHGDLL